ncbi:hypothetical protein EZV62_006100 [Acer yangbiense]|uniref:Cyclic nucleotide-binding domain-containing protein n=1 Tax=Acer yangbiense TaxID=1000413 RepID=A0A5C7IPK6_9ROSI|nr:hypothetical protein EZV62_006100 [Acer yangbiense]
MLFLVQGKLRTYSLTSVDTGSAESPPCFEISINHLEDGEFCGEELVAWFQADLYSSNLPISTRTIQTTTKVDAFALMYYDLQNVFFKHQTSRSTSTQVQEPPAESQPPQASPALCLLQSLWRSSLQVGFEITVPCFVASSRKKTTIIIMT